MKALLFNVGLIFSSIERVGCRVSAAEYLGVDQFWTEKWFLLIRFSQELGILWSCLEQRPGAPSPLVNIRVKKYRRPLSL
jgi:hypothetical protein